jgi:hypothetical protein
VRKVAVGLEKASVKSEQRFMGNLVGILDLMLKIHGLDPLEDF